MHLDKTFVKEIKRESGNGSRESKFYFLDKLLSASRDLSTIKVREIFNDCISKHGRAVVGVCIAQTLIERRERLNDFELAWAKEVISILPQCMTKSCLDRITINDGLHPTRICEYAKELIDCTKE